MEDEVMVDVPLADGVHVCCVGRHRAAVRRIVSGFPRSRRL